MCQSHDETKLLALEMCIFRRMSDSFRGSLGNAASRKSLVVAIIRFFHRLSSSSSSAALRAETEGADCRSPLRYGFRRLLCTAKEAPRQPRPRHALRSNNAGTRVHKKQRRKDSQLLTFALDLHSPAA